MWYTHRKQQGAVRVMNSLRFPVDDYRVLTFEYQNQRFSCRAWEGVPYCASPVDDIQRLNLYAPECYFDGGSLNGYTAQTAPIFLPNLVGGYMPGPAGKPALDENGQANTVLEAIMHGYVVACAGIRGRSMACGKAPALIVDMKAAIRYLRHNRGLIPGDTERMITSGTSAGGALSALAGASGNNPDYLPYLQAIGAADERDDVFAANCYCPIINLENADPAYEWQFCGERFFRSWHGEGVMDDAQDELSHALRPLFAPYLNSLGLADENGCALALDADGTGTFLDHVCRRVMCSAQRAMDAQPGWAAPKYLRAEGGKVTGIDFPAYVHAITRMKTPPAFDALDLSSPENDVFDNCHFTLFGAAHSQKSGGMADTEAVRLINPMRLLDSPGLAGHWRIRHGSHDRDTSLAVPIMLESALRMRGCEVDFHLPWGLPHSGDYDLPELFRWMDALCRRS